ncbi:protein D3-like [Toxorhynchites rutilus septentrionalis]|uniref:protein D3-like n=1 Tax=Toxorhynchites rutilus septentrionalis TaxID=329112 RepID=UPI0024796CDA|nr:protein D3-like [Toxorhynchites rutilus septentrionalis]
MAHVKRGSVAIIALFQLICYAATSEAGADTDQVRELFIEHEVIPDVVDAAPKELAKITYGSGVTVKGGNELTPTQVKDQPKIEWTADPNAYYTLFMVDPDAPSRTDPKFRSFWHWYVGNIPGDKIDEGDHRIAFIGSGPPQGTGLHRYVFLIYKQNGKIDLSDAPRTSERSSNNRKNFQHKDFVSRYKLSELVAGNFYRAQFDDYVPKLHAQLSSGTE